MTRRQSTLDVANTLIQRCQSTILMVTATPKGLKGSLGRGERANLTIHAQLRAFREDVSMRYKTETGPDHVLMGWFGTPYRSIRGKDYTGEVVPFGEICLGRNHTEDGAKLNMRCMRGVFVGKLDRTDEFLLLTPTGAMKTRCVRRLEGDNAWNLQFLNLCVGNPWNATARSTNKTPTIPHTSWLKGIEPMLVMLIWRPATHRIWTFPWFQVLREFCKTTARLGITLVPHQMRHLGVSIDRTRDPRSQEAAQRRGRWKLPDIRGP